MLLVCKICNIEFKSNNSLSSHLSNKHNEKFLNYFIRYESFVIPSCKFCDNDAKYKGDGLIFRKTCTSKECISKELSSRKHSKETKEKLRNKRLEFMKNNPEQTAWRKRNKPSYPEQIFINKINELNLHQKFNIVREKSFFPYYADFAFENVKVVIEIDGSQHEDIERKIQDIKKDKLIQSLSWRVYRVKASQIEYDCEEVIRELLSFIGEIDSLEKIKFSRIITEREKKEKTKEIELKNKKDLKEKELNSKIEKLLKSSIDFSKFGWVEQASKIIEISPQKVNQWMKRNMNEFYEEKCFKKKQK